MLGLFKKKIPAPEWERATLAKRIFLERCESDPMARIWGFDPREITGEMLMQGAPEATVLRVVEQFLMMQDQGATEEFAVKTLNQMHSEVLSMAGKKLTQIRQASTPFQYIRHIMDELHNHGGLISDHFLNDANQ
jgi:hypothetical protein